VAGAFSLDQFDALSVHRFLLQFFNGLSRTCSTPSGNWYPVDFIYHGKNPPAAIDGFQGRLHVVRGHGLEDKTPGGLRLRNRT